MKIDKVHAQLFFSYVEVHIKKIFTAQLYKDYYGLTFHTECPARTLSTKQFTVLKSSRSIS